MRPPNSIQLFSYRDISGSPSNQAMAGPATVIVEAFVAYIGAPSALARSALVVTDQSSPTPGATIWEVHVDPGGDGQPRYFYTPGRWVFSLPNEGPNEWCDPVPTTGAWDVAAYGFVLAGVNPNFPSQS